jgi:hypothetical protein
VTRGVHLAPIVSDEQENEGVLRSRPIAAMGANPCRGRSEVIVDPLHDTAAFLSLALA